MSVTEEDLVDETLLIIAELDFYDARSLHQWSKLPLTQRGILTELLFSKLPGDKQQTVLWRLRRVELRWNKVMT
jgi:hypothetical protein